MNKRKRLFRKTKRTNRRLSHNFKTPFLGTMSLVAVLSGLLLFYTGIINKQNIYASYCRDYGFGNQIVLYKNGLFTDCSSGCFGSTLVKGTWIISDNLLVLFPKHEEYKLSLKYIISNNALISFETKKIQYIFCDDVEETEELIYVCGGT